MTRPTEPWDVHDYVFALMLFIGTAFWVMVIFVMGA